MHDFVIRETTKHTWVSMDTIGTDDKPRHYVSYLAEVLKRLERRLLVGDPKLTPDTDVEEVSEEGVIQERLRGKVAFRLEHFVVDGFVVHGVIRKGIYGSHDIALGPDQDAEDMPLDGRAPSSAYRFVINLPESGVSGAMAVEAIGTSCPADHFARWLRYESRQLSEDQYRKAREEATGDDVPVRSTWWNPLARQMTDPGHLDNLLRSGLFSEIRLEKRAYGAGRGPKGDLTYKITAPSIPASRVSQLREVLRGWFRGEGSDGNRPTDADGAAQLAALIDPTDLADIHFDDGYIKIDEPGSRAISPSRLRDLFTYPQSSAPSDRPTPGLTFYLAVRDVAVRLQAAADHNAAGLEWPMDIKVGERA